MKRESKMLLEKIVKCRSIATAKAHAEAILLIEEQAELVDVKMSPMWSGGPFINCIKELRGITGMGLKESKDLVEQGHTWKSISKFEASIIVDRMKSAGAKIEILGGALA